MSKFNYDAYRKVYPEQSVVSTESAVDGFHPTEEAQKATNNEPGEQKTVDAPEEAPDATEDTGSADKPEGETE